jgi:hypothetical protein
MIVFLLSLAAVFAATLAFPESAFAWGPITHIVHGSAILERLDLLPHGLQSALALHQSRYLYGCVGADIIQAKAYTRNVAMHCHRWPVAWKIVNAAETEGELAFAWGYMTHLAADIVSHNHFVPAHLLQSFDARTSGHAYWEARADVLQDDVNGSRLRAVLGGRYEDCDRLVNRVINDTLFSFKTNKRIFDSLMALSKLERWQRVVRNVNDRSRHRLTRETVDVYNRACVGSAVDLLTNRTRSFTQDEDPTGKAVLGRAMALRRKLRALKKERKLPHGLQEEMAAQLLPDQLLSVRVAA